jgi:hypothetical protein
MNYKGKANGLSTDFASSVSSDPAGTQVQLPTNRYMINMDTGSPEFTTTAMKDFYINRVAVLPAQKMMDASTGKTVLVPVDRDEKKLLEASGDLIYFPFAVGNTQPLRIGTAPEIGKFSYAIPLYEPNANGQWVIPKEYRKIKTTGGSPTLSQITSRNKWDEQTQVNWDNAYFDLMSKVVDEVDAIAVKKSKKAAPVKVAPK